MQRLIMRRFFLPPPLRYVERVRVRPTRPLSFATSYLMETAHDSVFEESLWPFHSIFYLLPGHTLFALEIHDTFRLIQLLIFQRHNKNPRHRKICVHRLFYKQSDVAV